MAARRRVAFAENLLKVAMKQFMDTAIHDTSPQSLESAVLVPLKTT